MLLTQGVIKVLPELLLRPEGKTLEFKENVKSPNRILKTIIAFANTAGGTIVVGVEDETKKVVGVQNILQEEERLANLVADSIEPGLLPEIDIISHGKHELLLIHVHYLPGSYYYKKLGMERGTFVRLGSTNRAADKATLASLLRTSKNTSFDEMPCVSASMKDLDEAFLKEILKPVYKKLTQESYKSLNFVATHHKKMLPSYGALLLFSPDRLKFLPDSGIRCVCYVGSSREKIIDQKEINTNLILAVDEVITFVNRHTSVKSEIGESKREEMPQFPPVAIRESVVNAIVHTDYSLSGSSIQVAVFKDRIEITNPGGLTFGQSLKSALSGISKMRNHVIGRIFRELKLIERLGSGIPRILAVYGGKDAPSPQFQEIECHFRVTLYEITEPELPQTSWEIQLMAKLANGYKLATKDIAQLWGVTERTARTRIKGMLNKGLIKRIAKSKHDPTAKYVKYYNS